MEKIQMTHFANRRQGLGSRFLSFFLIILGLAIVAGQASALSIAHDAGQTSKLKRTHHRHVKHHHAGRVATKKPAHIQNEIKPHMPPPGHEGEEINDWFYRRRAWPNATIDPEAYPNALAQAARMPVMDGRMGKDGTLSSFVWQSIGPYSIDGRVSCIATHPTDSNTFYIGAAAGGLWKTTDHGGSWHCVTDTFGTLAMGCVAIDPVQPETIYIGQGEPNESADSYPGNGLWKSTDGGGTWSYLGFAKSRFIAKIIIDPYKHNNLYVAIPGSRALTDTNRGIFRSTDGGVTWSHSLFVRLGPPGANCVGFIDLAMNPLNSAQLVAFAWDHTLNIGLSYASVGPNTGIYRSTDSGASWARIDTLANSGLPNGAKMQVLGRGALLWVAGGDKPQSAIFAAYTRVDSNKVTHYLTDDNFEGLYRSMDAGITWTRVLDSTVRIPMGGVQGKDSANITNAQGGYDLFLAAGPAPIFGYPQLYLGGIDIFRSTDVGVTWKDITDSYSQYYVKADRRQHSDQHGLAFSAAKSATDMLVVSDGGVFNTHDFGASWSQMTGLPITMFYAVEPWRSGMQNTPAKISASDLKVFGGTQDNGTVSRGLNAVPDFAWINHGDGEVAISHPTDSNKLITSLQFGVIFARNSLDSLVPAPLGMRDTTHDNRPRWHTLVYRLLKAPHPLTDTEEAVAWTAPIALDDARPTELYTGRCHVYKATLDWNDLENTTWKTWSPIIAGATGNDSLWYYGDIETIALGPRDAAGHPMIWAGGYGSGVSLWRTTVDPTRNDTTAPHWITARSGLPNAVISQVVPDRSDSLTAFASIVSASNVAHVLRTIDGGKHWKNISANLPVTPVSSLVIDSLAEHGDPSLKNQVLIAATDVGVFVTTNGGAQWAQLGTGMPHIIVSDLKIYKNMLIAATHGRSLYAMDISDLQAVRSSVQASRPNAAPSITIFPNPIDGSASFTVQTGNQVLANACRIIEASSGREFGMQIENDGPGQYRVQPSNRLLPGAYIVQLFGGSKLIGEGRVSVVR